MNIKAEFEGMIDSTILKDALSALTAVVDNGTMRITNEGITVKAVNPENTAMVSLDMKRGEFSDYNLEGEELAVGMDFNKLLYILKLCNGEEDIKIKINAKKVQIHTGYISYDLPLPTLDALRREPKLPELEFSATVTIKSEDFKKGILSADTVFGKYVNIGEGYVWIGISSETFYMRVGNKEDGFFHLVIQKEDLALFNATESVKSMFSIDNLTRMTSGIVGELLTLKTNNDYPLQMSFNVTERCEIEYLLAPRIPDESL